MSSSLPFHFKCHNSFYHVCHTWVLNIWNIALQCGSYWKSIGLMSGHDEAKLVKKSTEILLEPVLHQIGCVYWSSILNEEIVTSIYGWQPWQEISPQHLLVNYYSFSILHWTSKVILNRYKQKQLKLWHQLFSVTSNMFWHL